MKRKLIIKIFVAGLSFLPSVVLAQLMEPPDIPSLPGGSTSSSNTVRYWVVYYINWFLAIVGIISVAYLIYGGFRYITSAGNEETAEEAKKIIQNAIIGLVVVILSFIIITVTINTLLGHV